MEHQDKLENAFKSLIGTSLGDAFGDSFFGDIDEVQDRIEHRIISNKRLFFTDDTVMSIAIYKSLAQFGEINQDFLALEFGKNYLIDNYRGYGGTAHFILRSISEGKNWREVAPSVFDGMGSMGNGAAMRAGVVGAYFTEDLEGLKEAATQSAEVTHTHHEAKVGAMAVAIAANIATQVKNNDQYPSISEFINHILVELPESDTKSKINKSLSISLNYRIDTVTSILGNGLKMTSQDTVPFALWCAAQHLDNFEEALWKAISGLGDRDTICAIVGSIVILSAPEHTIPKTWLEKLESIEGSPFWEN